MKHRPLRPFIWATYTCSVCGRMRNMATQDEPMAEMKCGLEQIDKSECQGTSRLASG